MAALLPKGGAPVSNLNGESSSGSSVKIRDSCLACAASKLRCPREKPGCSRCAKRAVPCEYIATKRAGRKQKSASEKSSDLNAARNKQSRSPILQRLSPSTTTTAASSPRPTIMPNSPTQSSGDLYSTLFSPIHDLNMSDVADNMEMTKDLDAFIASCSNYAPIDNSNSNSFSYSDPFLARTDSNASLATDNHFEWPGFDELLAFSNSSSPPGLDNNSLTLSSSVPSTTSSQSIMPSTGNCSCLAQALAFMEQLQKAPSEEENSTSKDPSNNPSISAMVKAVVGRNETVVEAVTEMLQCPCSHDGYILTMFCLIVFRVLGWYAAAARKTLSTGRSSNDKSWPGSPQRSRKSSIVSGSDKSSGYNIDGEDSRLAAHMIVNEMHRVRRLVNLLSPKLGMQAAITSGISDTANCLERLESDNALSGVMLAQLDLDLRKRVKALPTEILTTLRTL